ncbi:S-formylglutathione hydrolase [Aliikangiella coralliicola]|uniref:S-formylglutathione hydrolase n=1 Tax=Aliikangiella coralliicola TaxID=2592383 RepID=A0A545UBT2_9GAMM|nr:S-formylglutathione hydrolase [Aliikangiella coralliicola]TQV86931.1 S-formylglutathione hydrolase [Aliikangiella coralliicola]
MSLIVKSKQKSFGGTQGVYTHQSASTQCEMELSVYLPEKADTEKCPVIYYLSGLTCTQENVTVKSGFQKYANEAGLIVVCPDTSPRGTDYPGENDSYDFGSGAGFYLNATQAPWSTSYRMYDYVVNELTDLINNNFPVIQEKCGIFGHSMGGHGALTIGLKNPEKFKSISAFSPIVAPSQCPWGEKAFSGYLGKDKEAWKNYDATQLIQNGHRSANNILIDQGTADDFLTEQLKPELFQQACEQHGQPLTLRMQPGYDHSYYFIASFMKDHISFHQKNLHQ